jgi:hypothetical protein
VPDGLVETAHGIVQDVEGGDVHKKVCHYAITKLVLNSPIHSLVQSLYCLSNILCRGHGTNNRRAIRTSFPHPLCSVGISDAPNCYQRNVWRHQTPPLTNGLQSLRIEIYIFAGSFEDWPQADTKVNASKGSRTIKQFNKQNDKVTYHTENNVHLLARPNAQSY